MGVSDTVSSLSMAVSHLTLYTTEAINDKLSITDRDSADGRDLRRLKSDHPCIAPRSAARRSNPTPTVVAPLSLQVAWDRTSHGLTTTFSNRL